ncbi:helix-turn-helix transcriptional regulator [Aliiroseovarius sp. 2305UL8-7]|uniref:helix-turn-helix transcriptional regulator n=1 Tax=Aliiroseovarius conchicola TaxID=3121637 RepID=UPI0035272C16
MTQDVKLTPDDISRLTAAIEHVGTVEFPESFCTFCASIAGADAVYLNAFFDADRPAEIYSTRTGAETLDALALYLDVAFVLDPFYKLFQAKTGDRVDGLRDIAPDDFRRSEYYAMFFRALKINDECGVMLHLTDEAALFLSLGIRDTSRLHVARLRAFLPAIGALARRHWTVLTPDHFDGSGRLAAHLDRAFEAFGSKVLSPREGEIARMILQGHSSKSIAINFDNSPETIKVHRRRIYTKLGVASQGELLSLFLTALRRMPTTATGDPLEYLDISSH